MSVGPLLFDAVTGVPGAVWAVAGAVVAAVLAALVGVGGYRTRQRVRQTRAAAAVWLTVSPPAQLGPDATTAGWRVLAGALHRIPRVPRTATSATRRRAARTPRSPGSLAALGALPGAVWVWCWSPSPVLSMEWHAGPRDGLRAGIWVPDPSVADQIASGLRAAWPGVYVAITSPPPTTPPAPGKPSDPDVEHDRGHVPDYGRGHGPWAVDPWRSAPLVLDARPVLDRPGADRAGADDAGAGGAGAGRATTGRAGAGRAGVAGWLAVVELMPRGGAWAPVIDPPRTGTTRGSAIGAGGTVGAFGAETTDPLRIVLARLGAISANHPDDPHGHRSSTVGVHLIISRLSGHHSGLSVGRVVLLGVARGLSALLLGVLDAVSSSPRGHTTSRSDHHRAPGAPGGSEAAGMDAAQVTAARAAETKRGAGPHLRATLRVVVATRRPGPHGRWWARRAAADVAAGFDLIAGHGPGAAAGMHPATATDIALPTTGPAHRHERAQREQQRRGWRGRRRAVRWMRRVTERRHVTRWAATLPELGICWHLPTDPARAGLTPAPARTLPPTPQHPRAGHLDAPRTVRDTGGRS